MIYFTSDWHIGHQNIIEYCRRPFANADKMKHTLLKNYNSIITQDDTVYFLGDMTLVGPANKQFLINITKGMPGKKHLILGNHDKLDPFDYIEGGFLTVHTALDIGEFILVHDPVASITDPSRKWLCGHVHHLFKKNRTGNVLNVGVDQWGFFPASLEEVQRYFDEGIDIDTARRAYEQL